jgi:hypothetical protein
VEQKKKKKIMSRTRSTVVLPNAPAYNTELGLDTLCVPELSCLILLLHARSRIPPMHSVHLDVLPANCDHHTRARIRRRAAGKHDASVFGHRYLRSQDSGEADARDKQSLRDALQSSEHEISVVDVRGGNEEEQTKMTGRTFCVTPLKEVSVCVKKVVLEACAMLTGE